VVVRRARATTKPPLPPQSRRPQEPFLNRITTTNPTTQQAVSYVSRRRLDDDDFDPDAVDDEGLPLVYNEQRIAAFWSTRPGELAGRCVGCCLVVGLLAWCGAARWGVWRCAGVCGW